MTASIILYSLMATAAMGVLIILFNKNLLYCALGLLLCLVSLAGIFGLLNAEFLAATQLMIYAGGVLVLILFGIMLTNRTGGKALESGSHNWIPGLIITVGIGWLLVVSFNQPTALPVTPIHNPVQQVGIELMSTYVAPFELSGILLLVCLIGAALTASSYKSNNHG